MDVIIFGSLWLKSRDHPTRFASPCPIRDVILIMFSMKPFAFSLTSIHSSRMRTTRLLTVMRGGVCIQGEVCPTPGGVPNPGAVCILRGVCPTVEGGLHLGVYPTPGGSASRGYAQPWRVCICIQGLDRPPSPSVNRMTHRCKNITLPQTSFAGGNKNSAESDDIDVPLCALLHRFNDLITRSISHYQVFRNIKPK